MVVVLVFVVAVVVGGLQAFHPNVDQASTVAGVVAVCVAGAGVPPEHGSSEQLAVVLGKGACGGKWRLLWRMWWSVVAVWCVGVVAAGVVAVRVAGAGIPP